MTDTPAFRTFFSQWWPVLTPEAVLRWLGDPRRLQRWARNELTPREVDALARAIRSTDEFTIADVALLDELSTFLGRPPVNEAKDEEFDWLEGLSDGVNEVLTTSERRARAAAAREADEPEEYAHVLVDEAQDLSPMQWRMVTRRGPQASWTIVGDPAQSSWPDPDEARAAMDSMLSHLQRHSFRLSTNYRNSAEIYAFAGEVIRRTLPDADLPNAVRSTGVEPEHRIVDDGKVAEAAGDAAVELLQLVEGTVGVIVPPKLPPGRRPGPRRARRPTGRRGQPAGVQGPRVRRGRGGRTRPHRQRHAGRRPRVVRRPDPRHSAPDHGQQHHQLAALVARVARPPEVRRVDQVGVVGGRGPPSGR